MKPASSHYRDSARLRLRRLSERSVKRSPLPNSRPIIVDGTTGLSKTAINASAEKGLVGRLPSASGLYQSLISVAQHSPSPNAWSFTFCVP